jgi:hypothetical protein
VIANVTFSAFTVSRLFVTSNRKQWVLGPYNVFKFLEHARQHTKLGSCQERVPKGFGLGEETERRDCGAEEKAMRIDQLRRTAAAVAQEIVRLEARLAEVELERSRLDAELRKGEYTAAMELEHLWTARPGFFFLPGYSTPHVSSDGRRKSPKNAAPVPTGRPVAPSPDREQSPPD